uniref:Uncharacterized protein LOC104217716 n=1 Tax=Nicotiana sylvestris TaxID=4096 RepID=A0A1U7VWK0_NICSY|nr:PREDICTED: uncharacterized protein LOC104217716 [Nicotiana sylvestris]
MSLANVLIDAYHGLINDKDDLTVELGEAEQSREDLEVRVVNLEETIESLKKEKYALTEKIANIGHARDNLVVVVVNLKDTIDCVRKEKEVLTEKVVNIEHERDDLSVVGVDLKKTIEELKMESRPGNTQKGKKVASEAYIKLESELNSVKSSLCVELEKNKQLQEELGRVKSDLEKSLKWTWSSDAITTLYTTNGGNRQGIGLNQVQHKRTKHIDVRHHFLRDNVEKILICMKFWKMKDQVADIFTKALSRGRSNILECEAKIVAGFVEALKDGGIGECAEKEGN